MKKLNLKTILIFGIAILIFPIVLFFLSVQSVHAATLVNLWSRASDPSTSVDEAEAVAWDGSGNIYVVGYDRIPGDTEWRIEKWNSSGGQVWTKTSNPSANSEGANDVAWDGSGNIYVVGEYFPSADGQWRIEKRDSNGNLAWTKTSDPSTNTDSPNAVVWGSGYIYIFGEQNFAAGSDAIWRIEKRDSSGNLIWARTSNPSSGQDFAEDIVWDGSGNIYVVGYTGDPDRQWRIEKWDSNGNQIWIRTSNPSIYPDYARAVAWDGSGNIYVAGSESSSGDKYHIQKWDSNGNQVWARSSDSPSLSSFAYGATWDGSGNIYVVGFDLSQGLSRIEKWDSAGNKILEKYSDSSITYARAMDVVWAGSRNIYVVGYNRPTNQEWRIEKYIFDTEPNIPTLVAPPDNIWINYNPTFTATVSDPDGDNVKAYFNFSQIAGEPLPPSDQNGSTVASGLNSTWTPSPNLVDGQYWWRAKAIDSYGVESAYTGYWKVKKGIFDFSVSISPSSPPSGIINAGDSATYNITVTSIGSFSGTVNIYASLYDNATDEQVDFNNNLVACIGELCKCNRTDVDRNGIVNNLDVLLLKPYLDKTCSTAYPNPNSLDRYYCNRTDIDRNGIVNNLDVLLLKPYLGQTCSQYLKNITLNPIVTSVTLSGGSASTPLTVSSSTSTPSGTLYVRATGVYTAAELANGPERKGASLLTVSAPSNYSLSIAKDNDPLPADGAGPTTIYGGETQRFNVTITPQNGFTGNVHLRAMIDNPWETYKKCNKCLQACPADKYPECNTLDFSSVFLNTIFNSVCSGPSDDCCYNAKNCDGQYPPQTSVDSNYWCHKCDTNDSGTPGWTWSMGGCPQEDITYCSNTGTGYCAPIGANSEMGINFSPGPTKTVNISSGAVTVPLNISTQVLTPYTTYTLKVVGYHTNTYLPTGQEQSVTTTLAVIASNQPTAAIACCSSSACGSNCNSSVSCVAYVGCNFLLKNNSTDPDGNSDIVKSEWDIQLPGGGTWGNDPDGTLNDNPGTPAVNEALLPYALPVLPVGSYTVELYVKDNLGNSDTETINVDVKPEASAGFMCSLNNLDGSWKACEGSGGIKAIIDRLLYFKDDSSLAEYSTPSGEAGEASIVSRDWRIDSNPFNPPPLSSNETNPSVMVTADPHSISLNIMDSMNRTATKTHTISAIAANILPEWREIPPTSWLDKFWANVSNYLK